MAFCTKCGKQNLDNAKFCTSCGATLTLVAATPVPLLPVSKNKNNWIKTHPEEYRQAGGNPEELNNNKETNETATPTKPVIVLTTFNTQKTNQLILANTQE